MAKLAKIEFVCTDCGMNYPRWQGQCRCGAWNTLAEMKISPNQSKSATKSRTSSGGYAGGTGGGSKKINDVETTEAEKQLTGIGELDRVLCGGVTTGSVNIISGDPGAGKTTLLSDLVARMSQLMPSLYCTAEESLSQFKNRVQRLKLDYNPDELYLLSETSVEAIIEELEQKKIKFAVIDSIQAVVTDNANGSPGSPSQVKSAAQALTQYCKQNNVTMFLIAHVNKNNEIAGPQTLVHIVDALLHIDTNDGQIRTLRANKNRFGDIDTVGIFKMCERGMLSVDNPSEIFLSGSSTESPGSAITCIRKGNRNLLLEIQCLTTETEAEFPQRVCVGLNMNRIKMLTGILRKHTKTKIYHDTFFNIIGGLKIDESETCIDLALVTALLSSLNEFVIPRTTCIMGELSLNGDVRPIDSGVPRVKEAAQHGFTEIFIPFRNYHKSMEGLGAKITAVKTIHELIELIK
ncbi:DNA repair protein RadA [Colwellia sp. 6M3]|jgi:DNA repair protein RadA/Sms|uniref:DNA repair protein RadA n=1 Tax=Colwellia sp. 6M3 TaxID=2759849 RepID=UPI0015F77E5B|nr:DNA repair protein RadA [Colwellia sp. 6M3]MBA6414843.1 DNA repair protein RadA [Colwellia sp. 6M3]|tara:strand:- start:868 stop:2256 length:1389 start_codon:yes stop_codon:yes gene_type:complete